MFCKMCGSNEHELPEQDHYPDDLFSDGTPVELYEEFEEPEEEIYGEPV